jgi:hypothetical protein
MKTKFNENFNNTAVCNVFIQPVYGKLEKKI